jgi:hypothetical protein
MLLSADLASTFRLSKGTPPSLGVPLPLMALGIVSALSAIKLQGGENEMDGCI